MERAVADGITLKYYISGTDEPVVLIRRALSDFFSRHALKA